MWKAALRRRWNFGGFSQFVFVCARFSAIFRELLVRQGSLGYKSRTATVAAFARHFAGCPAELSFI
ncbi:MAG: hypothetical protein LBC78_02440, partial [Oscillospiraceae bacterium]|nr:hypothetical protein [Oscillospiraceae bacterium]